MLTEQKTTTYDDYHLPDSVEDDKCPDCGSELIHTGGCKSCLCCGWSACSI